MRGRGVASAIPLRPPSSSGLLSSSACDCRDWLRESLQWPSLPPARCVCLLPHQCELAQKLAAIVLRSDLRRQRIRRAVQERVIRGACEASALILWLRYEPGELIRSHRRVGSMRLQRRRRSAADRAGTLARPPARPGALSGPELGAWEVSRQSSARGEQRAFTRRCAVTTVPAAEQSLLQRYAAARTIEPSNGSPVQFARWDQLRCTRAPWGCGACGPLWSWPPSRLARIDRCNDRGASRPACKRHL